MARPTSQTPGGQFKFLIAFKLLCASVLIALIGGHVVKGSASRLRMRFVNLRFAGEKALTRNHRRV